MGIDRDEDDLGNGVETNTGTFVNGQDTGTNPALADTDGDGFDDGVEVAAGSDPNSAASIPGVVPIPALGPLPSMLLVGALAIAAGRGLRRRRTG